MQQEVEIEGIEDINVQKLNKESITYMWNLRRQRKSQLSRPEKENSSTVFIGS